MIKQFVCLFVFVCLCIGGYAQAPAKKKSAVKPAPAVSRPAPKPPVFAEKEQLVEISTVYGKIIVKLYNKTPLHRDNFIKLVKEGFYDSLLFHRVIRNFMIQGGDPTSKHAPKDSMLGMGDVGYRIPAELDTMLIHQRGALAAARDENPTMASSGCQFYIVQGKRFTSTELINFENQVNLPRKYQLLQTFMTYDSIKAIINDYVGRGDKEGLNRYTQSLQPVIDSIFKPYEFRYTRHQRNVYTTVGGAPHLDGKYTVFGQVVSGMEVVDRIAALPVNKVDRPVADLRMKMRLLE